MPTGYHPPAQHPVPERVLARIWESVERKHWSECWPWRLSTTSNGYGQVSWWVKEIKANRMTNAHRVVWERVHGPIPVGMTVDHRCRNRVCCNHLHLRLLTNVANASDNGWHAGTRTAYRKAA